MLNIMLSIFLGAMLGIGFGLIAEMMDRRVRSREDISELLEIPVFALIQDNPSKTSKSFMGLFNHPFKTA